MHHGREHASERCSHHGQIMCIPGHGAMSRQERLKFYLLPGNLLPEFTPQIVYRGIVGNSSIMFHAKVIAKKNLGVHLNEVFQDREVMQQAPGHLRHNVFGTVFDSSMRLVMVPVACVLL